MFSLRDNFPAEMKSVVSITALALFLCNIFFMPFAIVLFYITIKFDEFLLLYFFIRSEIWLNKKIISNFFLRDEKCEITICDIIFVQGKNPIKTAMIFSIQTQGKKSYSNVTTNICFSLHLFNLQRR